MSGGGEARTEGPALDRDTVLAALEEVKDPEIPVVSVVDLGIVQSIEIEERAVRVTITPTFSGCPALDVMRGEIRDRVLEVGADSVEVVVALDPPWSSDRITPEARARMAEIGIGPPPPASRFTADLMLDFVGPEIEAEVQCPFCGSTHTRLESAFGPTICRSLHYCESCLQPFERFKSL